jgi:hypothetical protein
VQVSLQFLKHTDPEWKNDRDRVVINNNSQNTLINVDARRMHEIFKSIEKKARVLESGEYGKITTALNV